MVTLEGAIKDFWSLEATLFLYIDKCTNVMYKQIDLGKIDLKIDFLKDYLYIT